MQPLDQPGFSFEDGRGFIGPGVLLLHVNSPLVPLALWQLGRQFVRDKYVIGYWAWELPKVPAEWRHGLSFVHEIWVPSQFTAEAVRPISGGRPIRIVPHPVALHDRPAGSVAPSSGRPFTVLVIFDMASSFARKNPVAAIAAFHRAFGFDPSCRLLVKTSNGHVFPKGINAIMNAIGSSQNVMLIDKVMTDAELDTLYDATDVLISLHRSEGFGLTIAEAMLRGLPVVATNWSGNVDFLNSGNGLPIAYNLVPAEDPQATYHHPSISWADADVEAAALALRRLRAEPELTRQLGEAGAAYALLTWGGQRYVEMVRRNLGL
jgi:glycosyltransferase involved in cell wall biosynthesis